MDRTDRSRPVVGVWRNLWLPASETFVKNHVTSLTRWDPVCFGLFSNTLASELEPLRTPFPYTDLGKKVASVSRRVGHRGVFDHYLSAERVALVHAHFGTGAVEVLPVVKRLKLPLIVTFHGHDVNRAPRDNDGRRYLRRLEEVFKTADVLVAVSNFMAEQLIELGAPAERVRVQYLGIPIGGLEPKPDSPRKGLLYVGRLVHYKGAMDLLRAYSLLPEDVRSSTPLTIVGDGPQRVALETFARTMGKGEVEFLGMQPAVRVRELMASAAVFVAPSTTLPSGENEAFGLTMIEAALQAAPVVSYRVGGSMEAVEDGVTGLLAPPGDVDSLVGILIQLLGDENLRHRLGAAGQKRVQRDFDLQVCTSRLEELYDLVLAGQRPY